MVNLLQIKEYILELDEYWVAYPKNSAILTREEINTLLILYLNSETEGKAHKQVKEIFDIINDYLTFKEGNSYVELQGKELFEAILQENSRASALQSSQSDPFYASESCEAIGACERCRHKCQLYYELLSQNQA